MGKVKGNVFLIAGIMTVILLGIGFMGGIIFQKARVNEWDKMYMDTSNKLDFLLFLNRSSFCYLYPIYEEGVRSDIDHMVNILEAMEKAGKLTDDMKHPFYILEFKEYLLLKRARDECGRPVRFLFYFYSGDDLKDRPMELLIPNRMDNHTRLYVFDGRSSFPIVSYFKHQFNITQLPALKEAG